ncbi:MAG: hypothetical protein KKE62_11885 [Proteobacteria bacterium]|nr:hypothetical protein [Pseudomonadota bacterium]MBU1388978.1 hypothetical protein [Pseudomonadota bacterium]MBU1543530.1 hypothetical protein [Pseudomonadota bacterium]MBU2480811.1 hypothetical protein [Pseudomonadota bacterium]
MKKIVMLMVSLVMLLIIKSPVSADVAHWPDWLYASNAQYASWDYWGVDQDGKGNPDGWVEHTFDHSNGLAVPYFKDYAGGSLAVIPGGVYAGDPAFDQPRDEVVQVNNVGAGGLVFYLDNYDTPNPEKWVRVIVNYRAVYDDGTPNELVVGGFNVWTEDPESGASFTPYDAGAPVALIEQPDGWVIAAYDFIIEPNPEEEWLEIVFGWDGGRYFFFADDGEVFIDEVQIHTRCVPIPGAAWLLGLGAVGLISWRRKS